MADFITHSTFADDILEYAHFDLKQHCARHANLFRLGAQGPDLFFYFEIRRHSLSYGRIGSNLHKALSVEDVLSKVSALKSTDNDFGEKIAFLLGFACHLSLDSFVHPYIKEREPQIAKLENCSNRCAHIKLETQFEAYQYGERTGKKPSAFNWHMDLPLNDRERQIAAELIGELSEVLNEKYTDKATCDKLLRSLPHLYRISFDKCHVMRALFGFGRLFSRHDFSLRWHIKRPLCTHIKYPVAQEDLTKLSILYDEALVAFSRRLESSF